MKWVHSGAVHPKFTNTTSPLYLNKVPKAEDVIQTNLGDCYLQAALASIAANNPNQIMYKMIYDEGKDVIVKLYKIVSKMGEETKYIP